jgi:hypothetical protein
MDIERHFDKLLALTVFLLVLCVFCWKGDNEFTQGLVTGSMLTVSTLLGNRGVTKPNGNCNGNGNGNGNGGTK